MHGLGAMTKQEASSVLLDQARPTMIKHLPSNMAGTLSIMDSQWSIIRGQKHKASEEVEHG